MTGPWTRLLATVEEGAAVALVRLHAVRGSAPREAGAALVVRADGAFWGTIGGGALEHEALAQARALLRAGRGPALRRDWPLGPDLGQCCGGHVTTLTETFDAVDLPALRDLAARERRPGAFAVTAWIAADGRVRRRHEAADPATASSPDPAADAAGPVWTEIHGDDRYRLLLFGAGHVGRALALALAPLPVALAWFDPRPEAFPAVLPANAAPAVLGDPAAAVAAAPGGAAVLVMTHSHPLDLAVVAAALARPDLGPVGLIGSATKRARFLARLAAAGLAEAARARLVCPVGVPGISGKEPAVIAAAVAAQVLQWRDEAAARPRRQGDAAPVATDRTQAPSGGRALRAVARG